MAALGAVRLGKMVQNLNVIRGVAAIYAAQGIDFRAPLRTSVPLQAVVARLRQVIERMGDDRYLAPDLVVARLIGTAQLVNAAVIAMLAL